MAEMIYLIIGAVLALFVFAISVGYDRRKVFSWYVLLSTAATVVAWPLPVGFALYKLGQVHRQKRRHPRTAY